MKKVVARGIHVIRIRRGVGAPHGRLREVQGDQREDKRRGKGRRKA